MTRYFVYITNKSKVYKISSDGKSYRWNLILGEWRPYPFMIMSTCVEVNPHDYDHPAFAKINFYRDVLSE